MPCQVYTDAEISQQKSERISELQKEVNETTRNYCSMFHHIYNRFGGAGLKDTLKYMKENDPKSYEAFIEHQKLDKESGRPYFEITEVTDDFVHDLTCIEIKYCTVDFDFKNYAKQAVRTDSTLNDDPSYRILHAMIGMVGELSEAIELSDISYGSKENYEALVSEIGDVVWYIALYYDAVRKLDKRISINSSVIEHANENFSPERYFTKHRELKQEYKHIKYLCDDDDVGYGYTSGILEDFLLSSARALDTYKKHYFYKQPLNYKHLEQFDDLCVNIIIWLLYLDVTRDNFHYKIYSLAEITQANIDKLKARYPEKFTVEDSLNRDYKKESEQSGLTVK